MRSPPVRRRAGRKHQATFFGLRRYLAGAISRVTCMADQALVAPALAGHGSSTLPSVEVEAYNVELEDDEGFVGDRACKGAFRAFIESWRKPLREIGHDPFGDEPSSALTKKPMATPKLRASSMARSNRSPRNWPW